MKDRKMEKLLHSLKTSGPTPPEDITQRTMQRVVRNFPGQESKQISSTPPINFLRSIGLVAAVFFLMFAGLVSTWSALTWFTSPDLASEPRIVEAQEAMPFDLVYPTWLPRGYSLEEVVLQHGDWELIPHEVQLIFSGRNKSIITITQGNGLNQFLDAGQKYVSNDAAPGLYSGKYSDDGTLVGRSLLLYYNGTFITIETLVQENNFLSEDEFLNIVWNMVGGRTVEEPQVYDASLIFAQAITPESLLTPHESSLEYLGLHLAVGIQENGEPWFNVVQHYWSDDFVFVYDGHSGHQADDVLNINGWESYLTRVGDTNYLDLETVHGKYFIQARQTDSFGKEDIIAFAANLAEVAPPATYPQPRQHSLGAAQGSLIPSLADTLKSGAFFGKIVLFTSMVYSQVKKFPKAKPTKIITVGIIALFWSYLWAVLSWVMTEVSWYLYFNFYITGVVHDIGSILWILSALGFWIFLKLSLKGIMSKKDIALLYGLPVLTAIVLLILIETSIGISFTNNRVLYTIFTLSLASNIGFMLTLILRKLDIYNPWEPIIIIWLFWFSIKSYSLAFALGLYLGVHCANSDRWKQTGYILGLTLLASLVYIFTIWGG